MESAKRMVVHYQEEIAKCERKSKLYRIAEEIKESEREQRRAEHLKNYLKEQEDYVKAMEFYLEYNMQAV